MGALHQHFFESKVISLEEQIKKLELESKTLQTELEQWKIRGKRPLGLQAIKQNGHLLKRFRKLAFFATVTEFEKFVQAIFIFCPPKQWQYWEGHKVTIDNPIERN